MQSFARAELRYLVTPRWALSLDRLRVQPGLAEASYREEIAERGKIFVSFATAAETVTPTFVVAIGTGLLSR